ncbi:hypothetical protein C8C94_0753 [Acidovorax sp. 94]|uniref:hypothetical protein n=1 Tax=Acidovorax sp. 94 TaxID=2135633 RepID=UPI000EB569D2|nr:hypothetical protein [Acidovorax sp. 94]RKR66297.1 hypothetical protein C8C94_0753 [Acidovorax sp. 94]
MAKATPQSKGATNAKAGAPAQEQKPTITAATDALASTGAATGLETKNQTGAADTAGTAEGASTAQALVAPAAPTARPDPKATHSYGVGSVPIRHNGTFYGVGYEVQLTQAQADRLGNLVTLIPATPEE